MLALVWNGLKRQHVDTGARDLLLARAVVGTVPQLNHVRPQIVSVLAFTLLIWILDHVWLPVDLPVVSNLLADGWMPPHRNWLRVARAVSRDP